MATVLKPEDREFRENPNRIDHFRLLTDISIKKKGIDPKHLNFDLRLLNPGQFSAPYHFHQYAEELFMILSGSATLRTPAGLEIVDTGDLIFFELGKEGAHQLYNHTKEPCQYLDIRTSIGYDVCEYPDSNKFLLSPSLEIFSKEEPMSYFDGERNIQAVWEELRRKERE